MNQFTPDIKDYRDIDAQEELSDSEIDRLISPKFLVDRLQDRREARVHGIELPFQQLKDTDFRLHEGTLNMIGGYTGHFKSTIASQIALRALRKNIKVGVASLELFAEDVLEHLTEIANCQTAPLNYVEAFADWANEKLFIYDRMESIDPEEAVQMCIALAKYCGCKLIVLDSLMMINGVSGDTAIEQRFSQTLAAVARKFDTCILLVHHVRKPGAEGEAKVPGKYEFLGSSHLANIAASIMVVWHDKIQNEMRTSDELGRKAAQRMNVPHISNPEYKPHLADMVFKVVKNRYSRYEGSIELWRHDDCRGFTSDSGRFLTQFTIQELLKESGNHLQEVL